MVLQWYDENLLQRCDEEVWLCKDDEINEGAKVEENEKKMSFSKKSKSENTRYSFQIGI